MVRKMLSVLGIAIISLLAMSGVSSAAPAPVAYPAPPVNVTINITINVDGNLVIIFGASGFNPGEDVSIDAEFLDGLPTGLRGSSALSDMVAAKAIPTDQADASGTISTDVSKYLDAPGLWQLTATGLESGHIETTTVTVPKSGTVSSGSDTAGSSSSGALASTGASVAGPIAIGAAALFAGLAMLFFGTRGVIRRKSSKSGSTA